MSSRLKGRWREVERLLPGLRNWADGVSDVRAIGVVGSFARRTLRQGSDLDLVVLCDQPDRYGPELVDAPPLGPARFLHRRQWGQLTELRARRPSGLHLDIGIAAPAWAAAEPLDAGTARVLRAGLRIVYDPDHLLAAAAAAAVFPHRGS